MDRTVVGEPKPVASPAGSTEGVAARRFSLAGLDHGARRLRRGATLALLFLLALSPLLRPAGSAYALSPGAVSITMTTDPFLVLDSNSPCVQGPNAAYVGFRVTNTSGALLSNLQATLSGFTGAFALTGGQAAAQYIGQLAAGASDTVYWYITYPCTTGQSNILTVTVSDANPGTVSGTGTVTTNSTISANAGGQISAATVGAGAVVGQIITLDVQYSFGGVSSGDVINMQPSGGPTFNAGCFQLVNSQVTASNFNAVPVNATDQLYFTAAANQGGSGFLVTMRYYFIYLCANTTTTALPYAAETSGATNRKYTNNYGTCSSTGAACLGYPAATNPFTISKRVSPTTLPAGGGTVTYTVVVTNGSSFTSSISSLTDALPGGVQFQAMVTGAGNTSTTIATNSSQQPVTGATGILVWKGEKTDSPFPYKSFVVPANSTIKLVYTALVPATNGLYQNTVNATVGSVTIGPVSAYVYVGSPLAVNIASSSASPRAGAVLLRWTTGAEEGASGFVLYRGASAERSQAVQLNQAPIPARGDGSTYGWTDAGLTPTTYYYWIQSVGQDGALGEHGPLQAVLEQAGSRLFVPFLSR
jgi:uncharacterized repeat protein (TIGR01451 family)